MLRKYNFEIEEVKVLNEDGEEETLNLPLTPYDAVGWQDIDPNTGEIIQEQPNWSFTRPRLAGAWQAEEAGEKRLVEVSRSSDLKARAKALLGNQDLRSIFLSNPDDNQGFDLLNDENDNETDAFNQALGNTPYSCDEKGIANYEKALASNQQELEELRDYMSKKDNPLIQQFMQMSDEERQSVLASFSTPPKDDNNPSPLDAGGNPLDDNNPPK